MAEIILAVLVLLPLALTYFLRSDAALGFLALCTGFTAATYASGSTQHWLDHLATSGQLLSSNAVNLIIIAVPLAITLMLTRNNISKKRFYVQVIPALASGGLLALAVAPLLADWINVDFDSVSLWSQLQKQEAIVVGVGALASLLIIWFSAFKTKPKKHK